VLADFKELSADIRRGWPSVKKIGAQGFCWVSGGAPLNALVLLG